MIDEGTYLIQIELEAISARIRYFSIEASQEIRKGLGRVVQILLTFA